MTQFVRVQRPAHKAEALLDRRERHKRLGEFGRHVLWADSDTHSHRVPEAVRKAANAESSGPTGGYTVPAGLLVGVDAAIMEESFFHKYACFQPMGSYQMAYPTADPGSAASGGSPLLGGFVMTWGTEATESTASNPVVENALLVAKNLNGWGYVSKQLVEDGGEPLGAYLENLLAKAAAFYVTKACFNGGLGNAPLGIVNSPASAVISRNTASDIKDADVNGMLAKLLPASHLHSWWACSPAAFGEVSGLTGFFPVLAIDEQGGFIQTHCAGSLRGRPVFVTETLPTLGTKGDLVLFDPRMYVLGQRGEVDIAWSGEQQTAFLANMLVLRCWYRVDGQTLWRTTATVANGATGVSPYVVLDT